MCGSPAIDFGYRPPGLLHQAKLTGLQPGHTYYYMCGDDEFGWSQEFHFTAASPPDPETTVRVSAFGGEVNSKFYQQTHTCTRADITIVHVVYMLYTCIRHMP